MEHSTPAQLIPAEGLASGETTGQHAQHGADAVCGLDAASSQPRLCLRRRQACDAQGHGAHGLLDACAVQLLLRWQDAAARVLRAKRWVTASRVALAMHAGKALPGKTPPHSLHVATIAVGKMLKKVCVAISLLRVRGWFSKRPYLTSSFPLSMRAACANVVHGRWRARGAPCWRGCAGGVWSQGPC